MGSVAVSWKTPNRVERLRDVRGGAWRFTEQGIAPYEFAIQHQRLSVIPF